MSVTKSLVAADAFRHGAINKSGWRVWQKLPLVEPVTMQSLSTALGLHVSTVKRALGRLRKYGLAREQAPGQWLRIDRDPATVVPGGRQAGAGRRQQERHRREREAFREHLERWRTRRRPRP